MAALKKTLLAAAVAAVAAFCGHAFLKIQRLSLASREMPAKHLKCRYLPNIENGAEDITILKDGLAFLSTGLHDYLGLPSFSNEPGKMYVLDLLHPKPTPVELQIKGELDLNSFNPYRISVYTNETDEVGRAKTATTCYKTDSDLVKERMDSELKIKQTNSIIFTLSDIWIISLSPVAPFDQLDQNQYHSSTLKFDAALFL